MTTFKLKYVTAWVNRHGTAVYYFRKPPENRKVRLPGNPGDLLFINTYHALLHGMTPPRAQPRPTVREVRPITDRKSLGWLCQQYFRHNAFTSLDDKTRKPRISILEQICAIRVQGGGTIGERPFEEVTSKLIRRIRDNKSDTPAAANNWLKSIKALFAWATEEEHATHNPARDVPKLKEGGDGFHTWTLDELAQWEAAYPVGTKARLALALMLYTGCRRADAVFYGPGDIKGGLLTYTQNKNRNNKPVTLILPVLKPLANIIAASEIGSQTFLVSEYGEPYTIEGFGRRFRKWAHAAGLPQCTPHGLRKAGAVRCAEGGATPHQMMAIFGWSDIKQAEIYTRKVSQKKLAADAMDAISWPNENAN